METKYKCEKCGSKSENITGTCCGTERKEINNNHDCIGKNCNTCNTNSDNK